MEILYLEWFYRQIFLPYSLNKCKHLLTNNFLEIILLNMVCIHFQYSINRFPGNINKKKYTYIYDGFAVKPSVL